MLVFVGGAEAGFFRVSPRGIEERAANGFTVEFEDDVDDSRTGGKPSRSLSPFSLLRPVTGGRLRVGLGCLARSVVAILVATTADEYDDAELGVGT